MGKKRGRTEHAGRSRKPSRHSKQTTDRSQEDSQVPIRLNRYIANSGVCSRREADKLIAEGRIKVNGKVITTLGTKVSLSDEVVYRNKRLRPESNVYLLLNKPKDFITTTDDPQNRRTVMDLVRSATEERIYPVGRLDRQTTGLLLLTNDGDLAKRLAHPSHRVRKIYHIKIDKALTKNDHISIQQGLELDDGLAQVDEIVILSPDKTEIGLEIHIGKNRIVRRIFEHLGYTVNKLDRVVYADLTKKDLPRGKWRFLSQKEVIRLKHF